YPSPGEIDALFAADISDLERVAAYAKSKGLEVVSTDPAMRSVMVQGPVSAAVAAFPTRLADYGHAVTRYRGRNGPVFIPAEFDGIIRDIFGFDNRPVGTGHFRRGGPVISRALSHRNSY